jgi:hypothetical protein
MSNAQDNIVGNPRTVPHPASSAPPPPSGATPYVMPRQTGTGSTRGTQNISGALTITDPKTGKMLAILGYSPGSF